MYVFDDAMYIITNMYMINHLNLYCVYLLMNFILIIVNHGLVCQRLLVKSDGIIISLSSPEMCGFMSLFVG